MSRRCAVAAFAALLCGALACGVDSPKPDARELCAMSGRPLRECDQGSLVGAEDACWRLVQCGAIPAANPDSDPSCCFDWAACVNHVDGLPDEQFEQALACIEAATCAELGPRRAAGTPAGYPACVDR
jgi:hypothetical protein